MNMAMIGTTIAATVWPLDRPVDAGVEDGVNVDVEDGELAGPVTVGTLRLAAKTPTLELAS